MDINVDIISIEGFLDDNTAYGNVGKVVVHEWAKLRWGVFEEHGYPGDAQFPLFFYKVGTSGVIYVDIFELDFFIIKPQPRNQRKIAESGTQLSEKLPKHLQQGNNGCLL